MSKRYKKILVIGGGGFIGRNLVEALLARGETVRILDRVKPDWLGAGVEFVEGDFAAVHLLETVMDGCDVVYHLASTTLPKTSNDDPHFDISSNLLGAVALLELAVRNRVVKFIFISSGGTVYGAPTENPVTESHATNPMCSYGIVKLAVEKYLRLFHALHGLNTCCLRLSNPYGMHQRVDAAQGAVAVFCGRVLRGEPIEIWGDGSVVRDYIFIEDAVRAMLAALDADCSGEEINIGSGEGQSLNQIIATLKEVAKKEVEVNYSPARSFDVPEIVLDIDKARQALSWQPEQTFSEGIRRTYEWLSARMKSE